MPLVLMQKPSTTYLKAIGIRLAACMNPRLMVGGTLYCVFWVLAYAAK